MEEKIQVLVVDDEADIRGLLRLLLECHGMAVIEAANGRQAITAIQVHSGLDLVILDVMMPKCDGVQACSEIRKLSSVPILFLTARTQEADMRDAYASGGDDYLGKPFSQAELLMKVDSLIRRYRVYKGKLQTQMLPGMIELCDENHSVKKSGAYIDLTDMEYHILKFLVQNRGRTVSVQQIYENVWHEKYMPTSSNTVMVHVLNLRKKLEASPSSPKLIRTIWGKGYQID